MRAILSVFFPGLHTHKPLGVGHETFKVYNAFSHWQVLSKLLEAQPTNSVNWPPDEIDVLQLCVFRDSQTSWVVDDYATRLVILAPDTNGCFTIGFCCLLYTSRCV